jgi:hypothetical protein
MKKEITFNILTPDELNEWFVNNHNKFDGEDHDAIITMNFFLRMIEDWFDENEKHIDSYEEFINRELH